MRNTGWPVALPSELRSFPPSFYLLPSDVPGLSTILQSEFRGSRDEISVNFLALFAVVLVTFPSSLGATDFRSSVYRASSRTSRCTNWCGIHHPLVVWRKAREFFLCVGGSEYGFFDDRFVFLCRRRGSWKKRLGARGARGSIWSHELWFSCGAGFVVGHHLSNFIATRFDYWWFERIVSFFLLLKEWQLVDTLMIVSNTLLSLKRSERLAQSGRQDVVSYGGDLRFQSEIELFVGMSYWESWARMNDLYINTYHI